MKIRNEAVLDVVSRTAAVALAVATTFVVSASTFSVITGEAAGGRALVSMVVAPIRALIGS